MLGKEQNLLQLHSDLGYKQLSRPWAKLEILLGLGAAGLGLLFGGWAMAQARPEVEWPWAVGALGLFVVGGYLALAGPRSHLYQSNNELIAYLVEEIRRLKEKG